jgi:hypothetical protein
MKPAAIGIRAHSGWAAVVSVSLNDAGKLAILDRRRLDITAGQGARAKQPYHYAETLDFSKAERFLKNYFQASAKLACKAFDELLDGLRAQKYRVAAVAVLCASGRGLPALAGILASHALIHAAEGEFFREVLWNACSGRRLSAVGIRERDLDNCAESALGRAAPAIRRQVSTLGRALGPPWTSDQKTAALAAAIALATNRKSLGPFAVAPNFLYSGASLVR